MGRGVRYTQTRKQRTSGDYAEFMDQLVSPYHPAAEQVDLVENKLNTHQYGSFCTRLPVNQARLLSQKLVFHFTPATALDGRPLPLNIAEPGGRSH